ncbi:tetratricopeptide repeat protein [Streptomyces palmae]|uniref:ATP-binding protein n=1 Tax=Streptomyces palmae TaxID=1701085 RepID=A0A4Z0H5L8_9ACTN|nr:tetratricopeptide repeat protein [Streptomyces palmae]TGB06796.1 ATP-binding protein [Streptomyces palmae]
MTAWLRKGSRTDTPAGVNVQAHGERSAAVNGPVTTLVTGDRNVVTVHPPGPSLRDRLSEWDDLAATIRPPRSPSTLLEAHRAVVPFRGRTDLLEELDAWCARPGFGVQLLYGPGGQGKTRLARHFTDRLAGRGWDALWLGRHVAAADLMALQEATAPLIVVVDYAETRTEQLLGLMRAALRAADTTPFKILLLARTAADWWSEFQDRARVEDLYDVPGTALPPLQPDAEDRAEAYRQAVDAFARALPQVTGPRHPDWPVLAARLAGAPLDRLRADGMDSALTLHMTALADLLDEAAGEDPEAAAATDTADPPRPHPVRRPGTGMVEERLLSHERVYWRAIGEMVGLSKPRTIDGVLVAALLCGARDRREAAALLDRVPGLGRQTADVRDAVADWIAALYPPSHDGQLWGSLHPDRLAEFFVGDHLRSDPGLCDDLADGASGPQAVRLLTLYARAAAHPAHFGRLDATLVDLCVGHPDVLASAAIDVSTRVERPEPLQTALYRLADDLAADPAALLRIAGHLPQPTRRLADFALHLTQRLVELHRAWAAEDPGRLADLAAQLRKLCGRLLATGRRQEAYETAREALRLFRRLAREDPETFEVQLAACLHNLSMTLDGLGRHEEAVFPAHQAVRLYLRVGRRDGGAALPELAHALNAVSIVESTLGRMEVALAANEEAVAVRRRLVAERGDAFRPDLAAALNNQAHRMRDVGRAAEGLRAARESVALCRTLAEEHPDAHLPALATGLGTLSGCLEHVGEHAEALRCIEEAVAIRRELAHEHPERWRPDLARSLNSLAIDQGERGLAVQAAETAAEAAGIYRILAEKEPLAYQEPLAMTLNTLSTQCESAGRTQEALKASGEAVALYRDLATRNPRVYRVDLAMALTTRADALARAEHGEEALEASREAVALYRPLAAERPETQLMALCKALNNLALHLKAAGRMEEALDVLDDVVDRIRHGSFPAALAVPVHRLLAVALLNKATCLNPLGRQEEALAAAEESTQVFRELHEGEPGTYAPYLVKALSARHTLLLLTGRAREVPDAVAQTVRIRRELMRADAAEQRPQYAQDLTLLGSALVGRGRHGEAATALREAAAVHRELAAEDPAHRTALVQVLAELGNALLGSGLPEEALTAAKEAIAALDAAALEDVADRPLRTWALIVLGCASHALERPETEEVLRLAADLAAGLNGGTPGPVRHPLLIAVLAVLGQHLAQAGRADEGLPALRRATELASCPDTASPVPPALRAAALLGLGHHLAVDLADHTAAMTATEEALELYEELAAADPEVHGGDLAWALAHHGLRLTEAGRHHEALHATARAVALARPLAAASPAAHELRLAVALYAHARAARHDGSRPTEAREHLSEALTLLRALAHRMPGLASPYLDDAERIGATPLRVDRWDGFPGGVLKAGHPTVREDGHE